MGIFITFEGQEGAGKSTQAKLLCDYLLLGGYNAILTREPGGTLLTESIRSIIMDNKNQNMSTATEALLFLAARAQLVSEIIAPHLAKGGIVICDRFIDSTIAYQCFGNELPIDTITNICNFATDNLMPDITFFLQIDPIMGLSRKNTENFDRIEQRGVDFHNKVKQGYDYLINQNQKRIKIVSSLLDIDTIHNYVVQQVSKLI